MANVATSSFSTGLATLPDVGTLSYNGATFSSLFASDVSWKLVPDLAGRTIKWAEVTITARGYVTLNAVDATTDTSVLALRQTLAAYAGKLTYQGKGFGLQVVNQPGGNFRDLNWGPKPEVLEFHPLGGSRAALVTWTVTTWISEYALNAAIGVLSIGIGGAPGGKGPLVQFNEETSNTYDEDCYNTFSVRGTLEIPMTRTSVAERTLTQTADSYRQRFLDFAVDLTRYKVTRRNFNVSRDKRTLDWELTTEELPPMGLPPGAPTARGTYHVSPGMGPKGKLGVGQAFLWWNSSLNCTYTVAKGLPRRLAWDAFLCLLQWKMTWSFFGWQPGMGNASQANQQPKPPPLPQSLYKAVQGANGQAAALAVYKQVLTQQQQFTAEVARNAKANPNGPRPFLYHFAFREPLYLDSRTMTFEASWKYSTALSHILIASGAWRWFAGSVGGNLWAQSVGNIQGWRGNLANVLDPKAEVIVDMGAS